MKGSITMYGNNFGYPFMNHNYIMPTPRMSPTSGLRSLLGFGPKTTGSFNFSNLLNGASKTLGVVKEVIPIVKEVRPMMNNMRSMLKIASIFKDETESKKETSSQKQENISSNQTINSNYNYQNNPNSPNFFL